MFGAVGLPERLGEFGGRFCVDVKLHFLLSLFLSFFGPLSLPLCDSELSCVCFVGKFWGSTTLWGWFFCDFGV